MPLADISDIDPDDIRERYEQLRKSPAWNFNRVDGPGGDDVRRLIVDRDPCSRCGIRKDIGCKHHPLESQALPSSRPAAAQPRR